MSRNIWREMNELKSKYLTYTEVCEELDKWYSDITGDILIANINDFTYSMQEKRFYKRMVTQHEMTICRLDTNNCIQFREPLPPKLTKMIATFYEEVLDETSTDV